MTTIELEDITLTQYMKLKGFRVRKEIEQIIDIPTYYRLIQGKYRKGPHKGTLNKLRQGLGLEEDIFKILLDNELKINN